MDGGRLMKRYTLLLVFLSIPISAVLAQDAASFACQYGELSRRVEVHYATPGQTVPCEVRYFKDTEDPGNAQTLWNAQAESGYCEARAGEFIEILRGWGWTCTAAGGADDTDGVLPAEAAESSEEPATEN